MAAADAKRAAGSGASALRVIAARSGGTLARTSDGIRDAGPDSRAIADGGGAVALPRPDAGEHLVQDDAERVDVRRRGRRLAAGLFRAEVVDGPHGRPGQRQLRLGDRPGDAEVGDLHLAVAADEDVAGLDVAVDEPGGVGRGERARHGGPDAGDLARRQGAAALEDGREVLPVDQLHDDVRAGRVRAVVVDGHDVRVAQRRGRLGLLAEARREVGIAQVLGAEQLDRHVAAELGVHAPR